MNIETRLWNNARGSFDNILNLKIAYCVLKKQPDVLHHDSRAVFQCFDLRDCLSVVIPEGGLCFPSLMEHLPLQRGVMGVSFFQHSYRKADGQFNASYSTLCCQNLKLLAVHQCAQLFSYTTHGRSCTQSEVITVVVLHLLGTRKDCLHYSVAQYAQRAHIHLPGSVFLLPSAPMMTSNSSSLTGCVLGWTSALQPISARCSAYVIRQKCMRRASRRPLTGGSGARRVLAFSSSCLQMLTYFQSLDLLGVQQDPWTRHWHGSRCPAGEPFWAASVGADEYLRHEKSDDSGNWGSASQAEQLLP